MSNKTDSYVAGLVQVLKAAGIELVQGISPLPVPTNKDLGRTAWVTVRQIFGEELENLEGRSGLLESIMQIDAWSKDYETSWKVRESIKDALLGFSDIASTTANFISGVNHQVDAEMYNDSVELQQLICRLHIWWEKNPSSELGIVDEPIYLGRDFPLSQTLGEHNV